MKQRYDRIDSGLARSVELSQRDAAKSKPKRVRHTRSMGVTLNKTAEKCLMQTTGRRQAKAGRRVSASEVACKAILAFSWSTDQAKDVQGDPAEGLAKALAVEARPKGGSRITLSLSAEALDHLDELQKTSLQAWRGDSSRAGLVAHIIQGELV